MDLRRPWLFWSLRLQQDAVDVQALNRKLILDTDGGVDDAQALLLLIAAGRAPEIITTVFGNVSLAAATRNILTVLAIAGRPDIPVHGGAERPLVQPFQDAAHIHGQDGLGGAPRPAEIPEAASHDGVGALATCLRRAAETGNHVDLLMIGPLTNLALALRVAPDCARGIGQVTIMGGTMYGRGNVTPAAEFNVFSDPEAAAAVFQADIDIVMVPWETCAASRIRGAGIDALFADAPDGPCKAFSQALATHARATIKRFGGEDHFRFVDPLAAAIAVDPDIVTKSLEASVDVALAPGLTRGMTVVDPSGRLATPKRRLVEQVDLERMLSYYRSSIAEPEAEGVAT